MPKHVIILGAGPAGLSAGWSLAKEGVRVDVIEAGSQVGGLCKSTKRDGFIFDLGGHRFVTKDDLLFADIEELMGDDLLTRFRKSQIRLMNKFFSYPLEILDILKKMDLAISLKCGFDFFLTKFGAYSKTPDNSFENWIIKRFGRTMYNIYFGPYSHKLWGMPPSEISSAWAAQRISLVNIADVLLRALGKKNDMPKTYARHFLYPKRGIGQIPERMAEEIEKLNGKVHLNAVVKKILMKNWRIEKIIYTQDGVEKELAADFTVSTIPLPELILMMAPAAEDKYLETAKSMKFRSIRFLHIMLDEEMVGDNTWIYIPEEKYLFFRIQDRRNWSPTVVPEGKNGITLEIACNKGDCVWKASDEEIFRRCMEDIADLGLIKQETVTGYFTENVEHAYPIYSLDYNDKLKTVYHFLSKISDFISIGRQGLFRYNNMDHSLKMGILTAKHILHRFPRQKIMEIATENIIFDWQDHGYRDGSPNLEY